MEEIWDVCFGYPEFLASNRGRIKDLNWLGTGKERIRKLTKGKDGYLQVSLPKDGKRKTEIVHRLIAQTFLKNPHNYKQVNHIVPVSRGGNNDVSNLEWCSAKQNIAHAWENGLSTAIKGEKHYSAKITEAIVIEIFRLANVEKWTHQRIADHFGICRQHVGYILSRKRWNHVNIPNAYLKKEIHDNAFNYNIDRRQNNKA